LVYKPRQTPMIKLARSHNVPTVIEGIEVLLEQGYAQFQFWTNTTAPRDEIRKVVLDSIDFS